VRWPSGTEEVFRSIPADQELMLIEGRPRSQSLGVAP
jgi:hypothetical protein